MTDQARAARLCIQGAGEVFAATDGRPLIVEIPGNLAIQGVKMVVGSHRPLCASGGLAASRSARKADHIPRAIASASRWIADAVGDNAVPCRNLFVAAKAAGHNKTTMHAALRRLGVLTEGTKGSRTYRLPVTRN